MDWKYKSSTRVPPLKAQSPEFKTPVSPTKKKKEEFLPMMSQEPGLLRYLHRSKMTGTRLSIKAWL
jgi:hypothetical protein